MVVNEAGLAGASFPRSLSSSVQAVHLVEPSTTRSGQNQKLQNSECEVWAYGCLRHDFCVAQQSARTRCRITPIEAHKSIGRLRRDESILSFHLVAVCLRNLDLISCFAPALLLKYDISQGGATVCSVSLQPKCILPCRWYRGGGNRHVFLNNLDTGGKTGWAKSAYHLTIQQFLYFVLV